MSCKSYTLVPFAHLQRVYRDFFRKRTTKDDWQDMKRKSTYNLFAKSYEDIQQIQLAFNAAPFCKARKGPSSLNPAPAFPHWNHRLPLNLRFHTDWKTS